MTVFRTLRGSVGLFALLLVLGMALGNIVLLAGAAYLLVLVVITPLLKPPGRVAIDRSLSRGICRVGETVQVTRMIEVASGIGPIFVYETLPDEMRVETGNNLHVVWKWPGYKSYDLSYSLLCPKRGKFFLHETDWETESPVRVGRQAYGTSDSRLELSVLPRLQGVSRIKEVRARSATPFPSGDRTKLGVSTTDFVELRPYAPGDPVRSINWKASARHSGSRTPLLVNRYEPEGRKAVWILLDSAGYMEVGSTLSNPMEYAIEAASILAQYYLSRGYTLGAYVYNSPGRFLSPDVGNKQFQQFTKLLLSLKAEGTIEDLAAAVEWCKVSLFRLQPQVFVITRLDAHHDQPEPGLATTDGLLRGIRLLRSYLSRARAQMPVWVVGVSESTGLGGGTSTEAQAFEMMQWETMPIVRRLHRMGVSVLQWDPQLYSFADMLMRYLYTPRL